ncbi:hypothetical protein H696_04256 [Fonticula alba]|uniref:BAR domain-containing protein n=1 Tax=Fonticula alba TaxID=691883 RepID=A0A058Z4I4_FONAL|nr:hypothetical protein H696_04256 [Fonticula alba]KCV68838.1 hypothetical protein H696_04256 [Fonticula alba]|eukprot:XP_009496409.1 hypothetical protein H696_04256 [Fonticula alba]
MSFSGFKRTMNRASTAVLQSVGAVDKTVDRQYDEEERRFLQLESNTNKLMTEARQYLDALRAMSLAQQRIAESMTAFYDEQATLALCGIRFRDAMTQLDTSARADFDQRIRATFLEPLGRFISLYPSVKDHMKNRSNAMLDYDSLRARVRRSAEKPDSDATRLPRLEADCNAAKELYQRLNQELVEDLPRLIDSRVPYLDPSFSALAKAQYSYYHSCATATQPLTRFFERDHDMGVTDTSVPHARVNEALARMRELTIVRLAAQKG